MSRGKSYIQPHTKTELAPTKLQILSQRNRIYYYEYYLL
jgi:hypothetical protein